MSNTNDNQSVQDYTCPNCGGKTSFNPKKQVLECLFCGSAVDVDVKKTAKEKTLDVLFKEAKVWNDTEVIKCNNCGCQEVVAKGQISTSCSFCGTNNIVKTSDIVGMKPQGICPFEVTQLDATRITSAWVSKKKFAPNEFKKTARSKDLRGMYSPAFTFDCRTMTTYSGKLGETETYTVRVNGKTETRTRTRTFLISGNYNRTFDDFLVQSASNIPASTLDRLSPFPTGKSVEYDQKYLAGYTANTYSKDGKQTWSDAQVKMENRLKEEILDKYDHDTVYYLDTKTGYHDVSFKYLLLPLYIGHHTYKGKNYNFFINGCTGKIDGKTPVSGWKIFFLILGILGAIGLIVLLVLIFNGIFS